MNSVLKKLVEEGLINRDNLKYDSRRVHKGDVFIALKGTCHDGHDYVKNALAGGAARAVCENEVPGLSEEERKKIVQVKDTREALAFIARLIFGDPSGKLETYGVTGTNGKTTTVFLIDGILNASGHESGMVSTVFTKTGDMITRSNMTTPDAFTLNRLLEEMVSNGKKSAVLEVSSHALAQKRVLGIGLDAAVFTNISPEHLDYHGNMETYLKEKCKIFDHLKEGGTGVLNIDDLRLRNVRGGLCVDGLVTFGTSEEADVKASNIRLCAESCGFDLVIGGRKAIHVRSPLLGMHNVYNMLAAAAALSKRGLDIGDIKKGLENPPAVPGRMEPVGERAPFKIFVDYAHTPDALENVLSCVRPIAEKRLVCVFGCGGDRDKTKRPVMGELASRYCDYVILTNDNPRTEAPADIVRQIEKGMLEKTKYCIILQRREAIRKAIEMSGEGDVILIAGKGHEDYQIIGDEVIHFDDKEAASEILKESGY